MGWREKLDKHKEYRKGGDFRKNESPPPVETPSNADIVDSSDSSLEEKDCKLAESLADACRGLALNHYALKVHRLPPGLKVRNHSRIMFPVSILDG